MRSFFALVIVPLSLSSLACSLLHRPGATDAGVDAGATTTDAAASNGPPPAADNVNEVARFPDEANLNDTATKVADPKGTARNSVPSGALVATLPIGTPVIQIASHDNFILCSFTDPKNSSRTLEGWVAAAAFVAGPTPAPTHGCGAGQVMLTYDEQDWCGRVCKTDKDCAAGQSCSGKANLFVNGKAGAETETCTIPAPGTTPSTPSGGGGTIVGVQQPPLAGGKCADKYVMASDKMCHFDCSKSPLQCPPKSRCTATLTNPKQPVCEEAH